LLHSRCKAEFLELMLDHLCHSIRAPKPTFGQVLVRLAGNQFEQADVIRFLAEAHSNCCKHRWGSQIQWASVLSIARTRFGPNFTLLAVRLAESSDLDPQTRDVLADLSGWDPDYDPFGDD